MFDEMPDQFYQFLAATTSTTTNTAAAAAAAAASLAHSFPLHHPNFQQQQHHHHHHHPSSFDASYFLHHPQIPLLHQLTRINEAKEETTTLASCLLKPPVTPWSNDEVLALLNIRSAMDHPCFPASEFTWDNVSRKLAEVGFERSAENCKDKFEEETRSFNSIVSHNCSSNKNNNMLFGELEELYSITTTNTSSHRHHGNDHNEEQDPTHHQLHDRPDECQDANKENNEGERQEMILEEENSRGNNGETGLRDTNGSMDDDDDGEKIEESCKKGRKRKREKKFELFKGFCEKIVNKMIAKQEEFHCKILEDMVKRYEDKNHSKEEAWRKQEVDRITKELEVRAHQKAIVDDRQAMLLAFLKKLSSSSSSSHSLSRNNLIIKVPNTTTTATTTSLLSTSSILSQDSVSATTTHDHQNSKSNLVILQKYNLLLPTPPSKDDTILTPQSLNSLEGKNLALPISSSLSKNPNPITSIENDLSTRLTSVSTTTTHERFPSNHTSTNAADQVTYFIKSPANHTDDSNLENVKDNDMGRRWPRDEVLALINIRCSLFNNNNGDHNDKESISKGPLWERISQRMDELGYKRSSKRCKEKWENINKYFRKTKDLNKKRSMDSRTCPYFHQLSHLYNHGEGAPLHGQSDRQSDRVDSPETQSMMLSGAQGGSSTSNGATTTSAVHGNEGISVVQVSARLGFEF